ncbi:hypothetical protein KA977_04035 [Candidatus Dependentiae bacterium]|nr:hypothetical protein [Candidatus Dependentiae bacterium]
MKEILFQTSDLTNISTKKINEISAAIDNFISQKKLKDIRELIKSLKQRNENLKYLSVKRLNNFFQNNIALTVQEINAICECLGIKKIYNINEEKILKEIQTYCQNNKLVYIDNYEYSQNVYYKVYLTALNSEPVTISGPIETGKKVLKAMIEYFANKNKIKEKSIECIDTNENQTENDNINEIQVRPILNYFFPENLNTLKEYQKQELHKLVFDLVENSLITNPDVSKIFDRNFDKKVSDKLHLFLKLKVLDNIYCLAMQTNQTSALCLNYNDMSRIIIAEAISIDKNIINIKNGKIIETTHDKIVEIIGKNPDLLKIENINTEQKNENITLTTTAEYNNYNIALHYSHDLISEKKDIFKFWLINKKHLKIADLGRTKTVQEIRLKLLEIICKHQSNTKNDKFKILNNVFNKILPAHINSKKFDTEKLKTKLLNNHIVAINKIFKEKASMAINFIEKGSVGDKTGVNIINGFVEKTYQ